MDSAWQFRGPSTLAVGRQICLTGISSNFNQPAGVERESSHSRGPAVSDDREKIKLDGPQSSLIWEIQGGIVSCGAPTRASAEVNSFQTNPQAFTCRLYPASGCLILHEFGLWSLFGFVFHLCLLAGAQFRVSKSSLFDRIPFVKAHRQKS